MKNKKGFTLVETLVAITILTFAISGSFVAANSALVAANIARDRLTASHLAQEGIEYVRQQRDNAYLAAYQTNPSTASIVGWNSFISSAGTLSLPPLKSGAPSSFTRSIQATPVIGTDEKITSTVLWNYHGVPYSVTVTDHLTPWQ